MFKGLTDCKTTFEDFIDENEADGKTQQVECPGGCGTVVIPKVYGTDTYTGVSLYLNLKNIDRIIETRAFF